jgi:hypothetical protein
MSIAKEHRRRNIEPARNYPARPPQFAVGPYQLESRLVQDEVKVSIWRPLFYWIFIPLLQAQLDAFRIYWNHHRVHSQKDKNMPSGHIPADAFNHPQNFA